MHWFGGSIAEAVTLSKQRNAIFVVFVEGENDLSVEMAATIDDTAVVDRLSDQGNFLAVKLKSGSTNYTHFAQIYQFVPVPSLFFIGRNGTPLEVVCAGVQPSNLATRIDRILEQHHKENKPSQPSSSAQNIREQTVSFLQTESGLPARPAEEKPREVTPQKPAEKPENTPENTEKVVEKTEKTVEKTAEKKAADPVPGGKRADESPDGKRLPPFIDTRNTRGVTEPSAPPAKLVKPNAPEDAVPPGVVCEGGVCVRVPKTDEAGPSQAPTAARPITPDDVREEQPMESESSASIEEKMERAKELIEARRREKADKEKEAEKEKEKERRAHGKGVAELKRWQAEQELKQIQEERKREKMANNLARQRVLEQIAQDRAERRARDAPALAPAPAPAPAPASVTASTVTAHHSSQPAATSGDSGSRARIQFKLPDGTSHTAHFDADDTLGHVQQYVATNLQLSASSFSLWTAFPRRELTEADASLRGLALAPSAALLVLPRRAAPVVATPQPVASMISFLTQLFTTLILEPTQQLYVWLRSRLFPTTPGVAPRAASPSAPQPPQPGVAGLRRRGNIHRLPSDRAADDDNNTWNGNSTQQM